MQFSVLMQSLWCCQQILPKPVAQVHVYLPEGTLALREGTKVHIDVLPLGVLLVRQLLEVDKEISLHFLLVEEVVKLVDDSLGATAAYRLASCHKVEVVLLFHLVLRLGIDVDAKRLMVDDFHRALVTIGYSWFRRFTIGSMPLIKSCCLFFLRRFASVWHSSEQYFCIPLLGTNVLPQNSHFLVGLILYDIAMFYIL